LLFFISFGAVGSLGCSKRYRVALATTASSLNAFRMFEFLLKRSGSPFVAGSCLTTQVTSWCVSTSPQSSPTRRTTEPPTKSTTSSSTRAGFPWPPAPALRMVLARETVVVVMLRVQIQFLGLRLQKPRLRWKRIIILEVLLERPHQRWIDNGRCTRIFTRKRLVVVMKFVGEFVRLALGAMATVHPALLALGGPAQIIMDYDNFS